MYNTSQCSRGIPNKSDSEQKQDNFYYSSPKAATDMGVSSSESHDLTAFYEMLSASFGVLSQNTGFYPSLDRIIETKLGPLNLGPGGRAFNETTYSLHRLTKQSLFIPTHDSIDSLELAQLFLTHVFSKHGTPSHVTSDRGSEFISHFF